MTKGPFEREKNFGVAMAITRMMLSKGLISEKDYRKIDTIYKAKYRPVIGALPARIP
ncbi:MAG: SHOCT domain-containing protein [Oscillospiraceae bacterium]